MNYPEALAAEIREGNAQSLIPDEIANADNAENAESGEPAEGDESGDASENNSESNTENNGESEAPSEGENEAPNEGEGSESGEGSGENAEGGAPIDAPTEHEPGSGPRDNTIWKDGKLRVDISINLADYTDEEAVAMLVQAGLFASEEDFAAVCANIGKDPTQIAHYEYNFSAGFSQNDIADYVTLTPGADD